VGELVALSAASGAADPAEVAHDERDWMVGVIRWLRITTAGAVDAGIEILGREARAAVVRSMDAYRHPRPSVRGVVLQAPRASGGHAAAVLAPTVLERNAPSYEFRAMPARWSAADVVEVRELGDIDVAEQTASFLRIQLPMVADGAEAETPADAASPA